MTFKRSPHFQHPFTCKSLGPNYLQIICHFTILHKITGHMMKYHGGVGSEVSDPYMQKMWDRSVSLMTLTDMTAVRRNRPGNGAFEQNKRALLLFCKPPPEGWALISSAGRSLFLTPFLPFHFYFSFSMHALPHFPYFRNMPSHL